MSQNLPTEPDALMQRIHLDLIDSYDEELEMEIEDQEYDAGGKPVRQPQGEEKREARRLYFQELFRLQAELVKLQDWVQHTRHKVVILFEGRDAAGKGGVIKRITQRLNPRVARCRAAGAERPRTHPVVLPALYLAPAGGRRDRAVRP